MICRRGLSGATAAADALYALPSGPRPAPIRSFQHCCTPQAQANQAHTECPARTQPIRSIHHLRPLGSFDQPCKNCKYANTIRPGGTEARRRDAMRQTGGKCSMALSGRTKASVEPSMKASVEHQWKSDVSTTYPGLAVELSGIVSVDSHQGTPGDTGTGLG